MLVGCVNTQASYKLSTYFMYMSYEVLIFGESQAIE